MRNTFLALFTLAAVFSKAADSIAVYIFLSETCPICQNQTLTLRQIHEDYSGKGVSFYGVFPNQEFSSNESIQKFGRKYKLNFELKKDEEQKLTKQFSASVTPEVVVVNNASSEILYRGKVDNGFEGIGKKRTVITENYLRDALESIVQRKPVIVKMTEPVGCFIIK